MNRGYLKLSLVAFSTLLGYACTTTGTGSGATRGGGPAVSFAWRAESATKGHMTATFTDGKTYSGMLFQITSDTTVDDTGPMWAGWGDRWGGGWGEWRYWDRGPEFITHYSGRVVANLKTGDGEGMRCNFRLVDPSRGMVGGGQGKCQLGDGHTIDATFPAA